jgi:hypothetical protein
VDFYWGIALPDNKAYDKYNIKYIVPGLLLFDHGPQIIDINSKYLKYTTVPTTEPSMEPALNVMVTVLISISYMFDYKREYVISSYEPNKLILTHVGNPRYTDGFILNEIIIDKAIHSKKDLLAVTFERIRKNPNYDIKYNYTIEKIGGFGEYYHDNSPR